MALNKKIVDITRELRRLQTPQEAILWEKLRNRRLNNFKFLRQHPIVYDYSGYTPLFFVADFYCDQLKLVIELDGKVHDFQKDYDANRDSILVELGLRVLRFKNEEVRNPENVLQKILAFANHPPSPLTHPRLHSVQSHPLYKVERVPGGELMTGSISIVLLAAGSSSRMGQSKQQLLIDGKSLLIHAAETAIKSDVDSVVVVLGSEEESHRKLLNNLSVDTVFNSNWQTGMGSSLKAGLSHVVSVHPETEAIIIMVCDQPLLKADHLNSIIKKYKQTKALAVASVYSGTTGVPALFGRELFGEILKLGDEQGAKKIIQQHVHERVDFPEGSIDLDTQDDYKAFLQQRAKKIS